MENIIKDYFLCENKKDKTTNKTIYEHLENNTFKMFVTKVNETVVSLDDIVYVIENIVLKDDGIYCDLVVVIENFGFIKDYKGINFLPIFEVGELKSFCLDNRWTNPKKSKEHFKQDPWYEQKTRPIDVGETYLSMDIKFRLPKDFNGTFKEALYDLYTSLDAPPKIPLDKEVKNTLDNDTHSYIKMCEISDEKFLGDMRINRFEKGDIEHSWNIETIKTN